MIAAVKRNERVRAVARRTGLLSSAAPRRPPARPVGAKLEMTHACNLRCAFCYTDSPRHTLQRTPELSDGDWLRIVDEVVELGVLEAVVTGGEPLLRRDLTLAVLERLAASQINLALNTNGWFVDEAVADRLAAIPALRVHVSLDGPSAELHERARGVPGSWRRAVRAIALLVDRGVTVQVVHVVTPDNEDLVGEMVEQAWVLGAGSLRVVSVVPIGGAARGGDWRIREPQLRKRVEAARARLGSEFRVQVTSEFQPAAARPPASMLVRPNGNVRSDSINPFRFGHALEDGLATCWDRIVRDWDHERVQEWRRPIIGGSVSLAGAELVPYRDEEIGLEESQGARGSVALPQAVASTQGMGVGDLDGARRHVAELSLRRGYRLGEVRWSDGESGGRYVRLSDARVVRLNATAAVVMDACANGTLRDAVARLIDRFPAQSPQDLEHAALATARRLVERGILSAAAGAS